MKKLMIFLGLFSILPMIFGMEKPTDLDQKFATAVLHKRVAEAKLYLDKGANPAYDPNLLCKLLHTIFSKLVITPEQKQTKKELIELLIYEPNTVVNCQDADGITPLMILVRQDELELAELLLATERVNLDAENNQGVSALDMVKSKEMRQLLKMAEVKPGSGKRKRGPQSPRKVSGQSSKKLTWKPPLLAPQHKSAKQEFFEAIQQGNVDRLRDMIKGGAPSYLNDYDPNYITPVMIAVEQNMLPMVTTLLTLPLLDLKKANIEGNTPLMLAVLKDNPDMVKALLVDGRSQVNQKNKFGSTALNLVDLRKPTGQKIQKLLIEYGAKK